MLKRMTTLFFTCLFTTFLYGAIWQVGPSKNYTMPSQVAPLLQDGDIVEIDAGIYANDVAIWTANNITIRGVGGYAHMKSGGNAALGKAIWVIEGNDYIIQFIEFSECSNAGKNGAGIFHSGKNINISICYFHENEEGLRVANNPQSNVHVKHSEFSNNGYGNGRSHNILVHNVAFFELLYSYIHHANTGDQVKSEANINLIGYNRIMDESTGNSRSLINIPKGGASLIVGNTLQQGQAATSNNIITYGLLGLTNPLKDFFVINNTIINANSNGGNFVTVQATANATLQNNIFAGPGQVLVGSANQQTNLQVNDPATLFFTDLTNYNYRLTANSSQAIDMGSIPGSWSGFYLGPNNEYFHPQFFLPRPSNGQIDIGAYEWSLPMPNITTSDSTSLCSGDTITLELSSSYATFQWSTGATSPSISVNAEGLYSVTVTNHWQESGIDTISITSTSCPNPDNTVVITETQGDSFIDYPMQIGRAFIKGEIIDYPSVLLNGVPLLTQANVTSRWSDGSVKMASLNLIIPNILPFQTLTLEFVNQTTGNNDGFLTQAEMLSANYNFDAEMRMTNGATTVSAAARDMLSNGDFTYWLQGPVATSIILTDHSLARVYDTGFDSDRSIRPIFHVTFWPSINEVTIRFIGEISNTESLQDQVYALELFLGNNNPSLVYSKPGFTHHALSRWTKRFYQNGFVEGKLNIDHNLKYLTQTTILPNYDATKTVSSSTISTSYSDWSTAPQDLFEKGNWQKAMHSGGGRPDIGPTPTWGTRWLYTGDWRMAEKALGNADLAAAWPVHMREGNASKFLDRNQTTSGLGKILSVSTRPTFWFSNLNHTYISHLDTVNIVGPITNGAWKPDNAHQPDPYFIPYLLSGEYWYLEQLFFWASFGAANSNGSYPNSIWGRGPTGAEGGIPGQVRAQAWLLRTRAHAILAAPDGSPEKDYFQQLLEDAIAAWEGAKGIDTTTFHQNIMWNYGNTTLSTYYGASPLYSWYEGGTNTQGWPSACIDTNIVSSWSSSWNEFLLIWALGRAEELGQPATALKTYLGNHLIGMVSDTNSNPHAMAQYRQPVKEQPNDTYFTSWANWLSGFSTANCGISLEDKFNNLLSDAEFGYPFIALSASSQVYDLTNGDLTWTFMDNNVLNQVVLNDNPKWAIIPRNLPQMPLMRISNTTEKSEPIALEDKFDCKVYPNPVLWSSFNVVFDEFQEDTIMRLLDMSGKVIWIKRIKEIQHIQIEKGDIPAGVYLLEIQNKNAHFTKKLIFLKS